jgi:hypothetical protein
VHIANQMMNLLHLDQSSGRLLQLNPNSIIILLNFPSRDEVNMNRASPEKCPYSVERYYTKFSVAGCCQQSSVRAKLHEDAATNKSRVLMGCHDCRTGTNERQLPKSTLSSAYHVELNSKKESN